ncbi:MAG: DUF1015 domain-containing protein [Candidatus Omnitrophota bacterium]
MAKIIPFKGIVYNIDKISDFAKIVAPPYDIISKELQEELYAKDPHNIIRLILSKESPGDNAKNNKYKRAAKYFKQWMSDGMLHQDIKPALYVYKQDFEYGGKQFSRLGFIALMKLETKGAKKVLGHERIFDAPRFDRFNLMKEVKANLCPIFGVFADEKAKAECLLKKSVSGAKPFVDILFDNIRHRFWRVTDKSIHNKITALLKKKHIFIADGHHRYNASVGICNYLRSKTNSGKNASCEYVMTYLASADDKGLLILPTHRIVKKLDNFEASLRKLKKYFNIKAFVGHVRLLKELSKRRHKNGVFGAYLGGSKFYLFEPKHLRVLQSMMAKKQLKVYNKLDTVILHEAVFAKMLGLKEKIGGEFNITYTSDPAFAAKLVNQGKAMACFYLNPTKIEDVVKIAAAKQVMPQKSTYFYPKLLSGLVVNKLL